MKRCPNCNKELNDNAKFCTACGQRLEEAISLCIPDEKVIPEKVVSKKVPVGILAVLCTCGIAVGGVTYYSNQAHKEPVATVEDTTNYVENHAQEMLQDSKLQDVTSQNSKYDVEQMQMIVQSALTGSMWTDGQFYFAFEKDGSGRTLSVVSPGHTEPEFFYEGGVEEEFQYKIENNTVKFIVNGEETDTIWRYEDWQFTMAEYDIYYEPIEVDDFYWNWAESIDIFENNTRGSWETPTEMNREANKIYGYWDKLLNDVYQYLRKNLSEESFAILREDEIAWIKAKEAAINEAEQEYSGDSIVSMICADTASAWTRERVYELIAMIP